MLATPERVPGHGRTPDQTIWHKPAGLRCTDDCDFHAIACSSTEGIVAPAPNRDVPLNLEAADEKWCQECRALIDAPTP
ncbi:hypothetical protein [Streptomyces sp. NRRL F-5135]|uniref:hypothetical protein n=1 Tax=Streptomyces sp. NRRL F-5135 TaxID=1463858 RepID=UPI0004C58FB6|nr:hypothetical protein [Streptomyces sp. NRRL F-5135]